MNERVNLIYIKQHRYFRIVAENSFVYFIQVSDNMIDWEQVQVSKAKTRYFLKLRFGMKPEEDPYNFRCTPDMIRKGIPRIFKNESR